MDTVGHWSDTTRQPDSRHLRRCAATLCLDAISCLNATAYSCTRAWSQVPLARRHDATTLYARSCTRCYARRCSTLRGQGSVLGLGDRVSTVYTVRVHECFRALSRGFALVSRWFRAGFALVSRWFRGWFRALSRSFRACSARGTSRDIPMVPPLACA